jgi:AraC-like DNA-binding protein
MIAIYRKYSNRYVEDIDLKIWLNTIYISVSICFVAYMAYYVLSFSQVLRTSDDYIITAVMACCIGITTYFGFNQPDVFNGMPIASLVPALKYSKTGLSEDQSAVLKHKLIEVMEEEKPHLNSDIRLDELAVLLGISRHQASQIINEHFQLNFYEFINKYRIQTALQKLEHSDSPTNMKELAYEVGFNNYVSFYKSFKKHTGQVPTDFKKSISLAKS